VSDSVDASCAEHTHAQEVIDSFESSFSDKKVIPRDLEIEWLIKAVARYSVELDSLSYDKQEDSFGEVLDQYTIDTLAAFIKQYYMEREISKVNKRVSIVTKSLSIDGTGNAKTAAKNELDYDTSKSSYMIHTQKQTAYV
jgi:hypothetical protein